MSVMYIVAKFRDNQRPASLLRGISGVKGEKPDRIPLITGFVQINTRTMNYLIVMRVLWHAAACL